jgi:hypothetical protein
MRTHCEKPDCPNADAVQDCYLHSTHYYWPEEAKTRNYFWCCNECITPDHKLWDDNKIDTAKAGRIPMASREF